MLERLERVITAVEEEKGRGAKTPATVDRYLQVRALDDSGALSVLCSPVH